MSRRPRIRAAGAVVGIHLDYQVLGNQNSMMLVDW